MEPSDEADRLKDYDPGETEEEAVKRRLPEQTYYVPPLSVDRVERAMNPARPAAYYHFPGTTVTVCCLTLDNGHAVVGHSGCLDPSRFDRTVGERVAFLDAQSRVYELLAYGARELAYRGVPLVG